MRSGQRQPSVDDAALHAGIIAGQREAFEVWEARYRGRMVAAGVRDGLLPDEAEEAWFSEVLTTIWMKAASIEPLGTGLMQYAFGVMRMQARSQRRRNAGAPESLEETFHANPAPTGPMPLARRQAVQNCLEALSERDRSLVELLYMEGVDPDVIAERAGIQARSVQRAGERARNRIRPCLEEALDV